MVSLQETIRAFGHPNIAATHHSTLEVTRETELTREGDCIIGVRADKGARDLSPKLRQLMKSAKAEISLTLTVRDLSDEIHGRGDPRLSLLNPLSMVFRRSAYACGRTVMLHSNKAAVDLDRRLVYALKDENTKLELTIRVARRSTP